MLMLAFVQSDVVGGLIGPWMYGTLWLVVIFVFGFLVAQGQRAKHDIKLLQAQANGNVESAFAARVTVQIESLDKRMDSMSREFRGLREEISQIRRSGD